MDVKKDSGMPDHSKAKVELYTTYLSTFLTIISRTKYIDKLHIYDLLCGEGTYEDGSDGSPIAALKKIKDHFFANKRKCPNIFLWFNDHGTSIIEPDKLKIDRVKEQSNSIYRPNNVIIEFTNQDISDLIPKLQQRINELKSNERLLLFIDPYGYKNIGPNELKRFLANKYVELIFFVPVSHIRRFARKSIEDSTYRGGEAIRDFLMPLMNHGLTIEAMSSTNTFINATKSALRSFLANQNVFVDTYTIERDKANTYCLFFFTHHIRGFEKMLETKWKLDENRGLGFRLSSGQQKLFDNDFELFMANEYASLLEKEIKERRIINNSDIYLFGLENGFLPKHSRQILKDWVRNPSNFVILKEDGQTQTKHPYINYDNYVESQSKNKTIVTYKFK
jgi:three-Cys-motif partner protein